MRAFNQVAVSGWTPLPVAVPAYPSVAGPTRVKKGTTVTLRFAGLLPNQPTTIQVRIVKSGKLTTRTIDPRNDGTATLRLKVSKTVRVAATSGGIRSDGAPDRCSHQETLT